MGVTMFNKEGLSITFFGMQKDFNMISSAKGLEKKFYS